MRNVEVNINGTAYPCRITMGAMLLFKQQTGREATTISNDAISDLIIFIWCCIRSASRHDRVDFNLTLEDFADGITPDEAGAIFTVINDEVEPEQSDKKKASRKK